jgi:hypothetical protein
MAVPSVSNSTSYAQAVQPKPEAQEAHRAGKDTRPDGDGDDHGAAAVPTGPTVNTSGQQVGTLVDTKA